METKNEVRAAAPRILVIDRSKWLRGEGDGSMLLRPSDGKMCCLGFEALECGYSPEEIEHLGDPEDVWREADKAALWPPWLLAVRGDHGLRNTEAVRALIRANDDMALTESVREATIAAIFAEHGVEVRFLDSTEQPAAQPPYSAIPDKEKGQ